MIAYPKPPITEAVIELRSDEIFDARDLERCRDRFKRGYGKVEEMNEVNFTVGEGGKVTSQSKVVGFKMTASNAVDIVLLNATSIATSRLAPYFGFDQLLAISKENFEVVTKVAGRRKIARIGARFVNRIDVPDEVFEKSGRWSAFVNIQPSLPLAVASSEGAYYLNLQTRYADDDNVKLTIQTGPMTPVLLNQQSLQLDIDVAYEADIPQRLDELWESVAKLRAIKNFIFEACITDAARELFK